MHKRIGLTTNTRVRWCQSLAGCTSLTRRSAKRWQGKNISETNHNFKGVKWIGKLSRKKQSNSCIKWHFMQTPEVFYAENFKRVHVYQSFIKHNCTLLAHCAIVVCLLCMNILAAYINICSRIYSTTHVTLQKLLTCLTVDTCPIGLAPTKWRLVAITSVTGPLH